MQWATLHTFGPHWQTVHCINVAATVELPYIWQLRSASDPLGFALNSPILMLIRAHYAAPKLGAAGMGGILRLIMAHYGIGRLIGALIGGLIGALN